MAVTVSATVETAMEDAACNAWADSIDGGPAAGKYVLYIVGGTTIVATCTGQDPFFGPAASGVATQSGTAVGSGAAVPGNAGQVVVFKAFTSTDVEVWSGAVARAASDLNVDDGKAVADSVIIDANATVTLSGIQLTVTLTP